MPYISPLSGTPYNSRFELFNYAIHNNEYEYTNMVYHGFYGGNSLQSQELNELQENIQNQISLSNKIISTWLRFLPNGQNTYQSPATYVIDRDIFPVEAGDIGSITNTNNPSQVQVYIQKGEYIRPSKSGFMSYISIPNMTVMTDPSLNYAHKLNLKERIANSYESEWNVLEDSTLDSLEPSGAKRVQTYRNAKNPSLNFGICCNNYGCIKDSFGNPRIVTETSCINPNQLDGDLWLQDSDCDACPEIFGVCCSNGVCLNEPGEQISAISCLSLGDSFLANALTCAETNCTPPLQRPCCSGEDGVFECFGITTDFKCTLQNGIWHPSGVDCDVCDEIIVEFEDGMSADCEQIIKTLSQDIQDRFLSYIKPVDIHAFAHHINTSVYYNKLIDEFIEGTSPAALAPENQDRLRQLMDLTSDYTLRYAQSWALPGRGDPTNPDWIAWVATHQINPYLQFSLAREFGPQRYERPSTPSEIPTYQNTDDGVQVTPFQYGFLSPAGTFGSTVLCNGVGAGTNGVGAPCTPVNTIISGDTTNSHRCLLDANGRCDGECGDFGETLFAWQSGQLDAYTGAWIKSYGTAVALTYKALKRRLDRLGASTSNPFIMYKVPFSWDPETYEKLDYGSVNILKQKCLDILNEIADEYNHGFQRANWHVATCNARYPGLNVIGNPDDFRPDPPEHAFYGGAAGYLGSSWTSAGLISIMDMLDNEDPTTIPDELRDKLRHKLKQEIKYAILNWKYKLSWYVWDNRANTNQWQDPAEAILSNTCYLEDGRFWHAYNLGCALIAESIVYSLGRDGTYPEGYSYARQSIDVFFKSLLRTQNNTDVKFKTLDTFSFFTLSWKWLLDNILPGNYVINYADNRGPELASWEIPTASSAVLHAAYIRSITTNSNEQPLPGVIISDGKPIYTLEPIKVVNYLYPPVGNNHRIAIDIHTPQAQEILRLSQAVPEAGYVIEDHLPNHAYYPDSDLMIWRTARHKPYLEYSLTTPNRSEFAIWLKGSKLSDGHCHRDSGHLSVVFGKQHILMDCGMDYDWPGRDTDLSQPAGHNILQQGYINHGHWPLYAGWTGCNITGNINGIDPVDANKGDMNIHTLGIYKTQKYSFDELNDILGINFGHRGELLAPSAEFPLGQPYWNVTAKHILGQVQNPNGLWSQGNSVNDVYRGITWNKPIGEDPFVVTITDKCSFSQPLTWSFVIGIGPNMYRWHTGAAELTKYFGYGVDIDPATSEPFRNPETGEFDPPLPDPHSPLTITALDGTVGKKWKVTWKGSRRKLGRITDGELITTDPDTGFPIAEMFSFDGLNTMEFTSNTKIQIEDFMWPDFTQSDVDPNGNPIPHELITPKWHHCLGVNLAQSLPENTEFTLISKLTVSRT